MLPYRIVLAAGLVLLCAASGSAQSFVGTKVVETGVNYPGVGTFTQFIVRPSISGTLTSFGGNLSTGSPALALSAASAIIKIADNTTTIPGGTGVPFDTLSAGPVGLSGSVYAFKGSGTPPGATGSLNPVAAVGTAYPGGGIFRNVTEPSVSGTTVAFTGTSGFGAPIGVFTRTGSAAVVTVVNTTNAMPNGAGNFSAFVDVAGNGYLANISGANVVFGGRNAAGTSFGLFLSNGSTLSTVATNDTTIPNLGGTFSSTSPIPAISGSNVAFSGTGSAGQVGVFRSVGGVLTSVADNTTTVPGTASLFTSFNFTDVAISGTRVAFRGTGGGVSGIYTDTGGTLTKVIATGDTLGGKTVSDVNIGQFAFEGTTIAVMVAFTNGTGGIYRFAPVPEPAGVLAVALAGLAARVRRRKARSVC